MGRNSRFEDRSSTAMIPLDGSPLVEEEARQIGDELFERCCLVPHSGSAGLATTESAINQNALFDCARRFSTFVRFVDRFQFTGYEVTGGKSVLYFTMRDLGGGATVLDGITDEIAAEAPAGGWSNEWLLLPFFRAYSPHDGNIFDQPTFADYYDLWQRGQWYAPEIANDDALCWHVSYGAASVAGNFVAEGLSGYNYAKTSYGYAVDGHLNQKSCAGDPTCEAQRLAFYKSCQIYKPPYEIESAETVTVDGAQCVKVTLTTRLQNTAGETAGAPAGDISRDVSTWDGPTLASEPFRTDENALRLYLVWLSTGYNPPPTIGDQSLNSQVHTDVNSVFAAIMPTICLVRLMPLLYHDENDTAQSHDSHKYHDC